VNRTLSGLLVVTLTARAEAVGHSSVRDVSFDLRIEIEWTDREVKKTRTTLTRLTVLGADARATQTSVDTGSHVLLRNILLKENGRHVFVVDDSQRVYYRFNVLDGGKKRALSFDQGALISLSFKGDSARSHVLFTTIGTSLGDSGRPGWLTFTSTDSVRVKRRPNRSDTTLAGTPAPEGSTTIAVTGWGDDRKPFAVDRRLVKNVRVGAENVGAGPEVSGLKTRHYRLLQTATTYEAFPPSGWGPNPVVVASEVEVVTDLYYARGADEMLRPHSILQPIGRGMDVLMGSLLMGLSASEWGYRHGWLKFIPSVGALGVEVLIHPVQVAIRDPAMRRGVENASGRLPSGFPVRCVVTSNVRTDTYSVAQTRVVTMTIENIRWSEPYSRDTERFRSLWSIPVSYRDGTPKGPASRPRDGIR
jgi:hypothetical protein